VSQFQDDGHDVISRRKCRPVTSDHEASARRIILCSSVLQFLSYSTFVFVRSHAHRSVDWSSLMAQML